MVPGAQYAGTTLATSPSDIETPSTTHPYPALLDVVQQRHRQGLCLSAAWHQHTFLINDLAADQRWPHYRAEALTLTPIKSILSLQLFTSDHAMGALNVYADALHTLIAMPKKSAVIGWRLNLRWKVGCEVGGGRRVLSADRVFRWAFRSRSRSHSAHVPRSGACDWALRRSAELPSP